MKKLKSVVSEFPIALLICVFAIIHAIGLACVATASTLLTLAKGLAGEVKD